MSEKKTIWKFPLEIAGAQGIEMPKGAEILCVQFQKTILCLWAIVDPSAENEIRGFEICGTGRAPQHDFDRLSYVSTFQTMDGEFVWHLFEIDALIAYEDKDRREKGGQQG